jgi:glycolate oxidase FAD binding subunit
MTITVQAGITIARLQEELAKENQRLPIDVPRADQATLGGALATNVSGPRRYGFGTLRDYVIGISVVNDEGHEVKAGGRVVKNVAGYDLCKLHIGALGTLGIITQVTLKLRPRPMAQTILLLGCGAEAPEPLVDRLLKSRTRPVCLELLNQAAVRSIELGIDDLPGVPWVVVVGFEDNRDAVDWQVKQLRDEMGAAGHDLDLRYVACPAKPPWQGIVEFAASPEARLSFKANLLPSTTAAFCRQADSLPYGLRLKAHAGSGIVVGHTGDDLTLDSARTMLATLQDATAEVQGNVVILKCPPAWKANLPVWGKPRGDFWLMRQVKDKLDPRRLFNPGRFVDGI